MTGFCNASFESEMKTLKRTVETILNMRCPESAHSGVSLRKPLESRGEILILHLALRVFQGWELLRFSYALFRRHWFEPVA